MKKILLFSIFSIFYYTANAQFNDNAPWHQENAKNKDANTKTDKLSLPQLSLEFNKYWEGKDYNVKGSGYKPFKRWEEYWKHYTDKDGYLPSKDYLWKAWENHINFGIEGGTDISNWESFGPKTIINNKTSTANLGRVNVIVPDPNNENIIYVGTPAGGIWKSIDKGGSWIPLSDELPQIGVSGIVIDPNNSEVIYIATGDDDASDTESAGVFKSVDGGATWVQTGLNPSNSPNSMNDIYMHPTDSNILWVATRSGLYKTIDGGNNWSNNQSGNIKDLKIKPGDPTIIYIVTVDEFYKSIDGGDSFTQKITGLPVSSGRFVIDVTPANPEYIYVLSSTTNDEYQGIYKSVDSGEIFTKSLNETNILESTQSWYDLALAVSDQNPDEVYVGCLNIWKSTNGADSFSKLNNWYQHDQAFTHADIHYLRFFNNELFAGTDGGFYKSEDGGGTFQDYTQGMQIGQFYRISVSKSNSSKMAGGLQDNGGFGLTESKEWNNYHGGDGMDNAVHPSNENIYYGFTQYGGSLNVTTDAGMTQNSSFSGPEDGNWVTPMIINKESELYAGYRSVYHFTGASFVKISQNFEALIDVLEIDNSNSDNMYVGVNRKFYSSVDRAINFVETYTFSSNINAIEVHKENSDIIYVSTSGFGTRGIFKSEDKGLTFTDITYNLPTDQAYFDVAHQGRHSENPIYVGTSLGVFRLDNTINEWQPFFNNLPNVPVRDLEISLDDAKITAATYGRGVWQSSLTVELPDSDIRLLSIDAPNSNIISCDSEFSIQLNVENNGLVPINLVDVTYKINGVEDTFQWAGLINPQEQKVIIIENVTAIVGIQNIEISISTPNDAYSDNNSSSTYIVKNSSGISGFVNDFEDDNELLTYNDGELTKSVWQRGAPTGTLLKNTTSGTNVYGTNLAGNHPDLTKGYLYSSCFDLSAIISPKFKFNMAYDLEENWDIIYVEYSLNNGTSWQVLGTSDSSNWYNSNRTNATSGASNDCQNCPGAQWTGTNATMTEYSYELTSLATETNVIFRFVFQSDQSVNQEGVIIDDFTIVGLGDTDGDGISDDIDNCPGISNADQADFDNDGDGDVCDNDIDGDGVINVNDNCNETPSGSTVDVNGCEIFTLPATNFQLQLNSETCRSSNNGSIIITAVENLNYTAVLSGNGVSNTNEFTSTTNFNDLSAGQYTVCITVENQNDFEICFNANITEPDDLSAFSKVDTKSKTARVSLKGAEKYYVTLNDEVFTTTNDFIDLNLKSGVNELKINTDVLCQGVHKETLIVPFENLVAYPNPLKQGQNLLIATGTIDDEVLSIAVYSTLGSKLFSKTYVNNDQRLIEVEMKHIPKGVYLIKLESKEVNKSYTIIIE